MLKQLTLWIWAGFVIRLANSINNGFFGPSIGADADAFWFHMAAVDTSRDLLFEEFVTGHIYSYLLGYFYYFTTDSLFLGSALSVLGWLLSAFIFTIDSPEVGLMMHTPAVPSCKSDLKMIP